MYRTPRNPVCLVNIAIPTVDLQGRFRYLSEAGLHRRKHQREALDAVLSPLIRSRRISRSQPATTAILPALPAPDSSFRRWRVPSRASCPGGIADTDVPDGRIGNPATLDTCHPAGAPVHQIAQGRQDECRRRRDHQDILDREKTAGAPAPREMENLCAGMLQGESSAWRECPASLSPQHRDRSRSSGAPACIERQGRQVGPPRMWQALSSRPSAFPARDADRAIGPAEVLRQVRTALPDRIRPWSFLPSRGPDRERSRSKSSPGRQGCLGPLGSRDSCASGAVSRRRRPSLSVRASHDESLATRPWLTRLPRQSVPFSLTSSASI